MRAQYDVIPSGQSCCFAVPWAAARSCSKAVLKKSPAENPSRALKLGYAVELVDHAKHDRANKGKGEIRGQHTQPVDESHGKAPLVCVTCPTTRELTKRFPAQKVSAAVYPAGSAPAGVVKDS